MKAGTRVTETDPAGICPGSPGAKLDAGKVPVLRGAVQYFPRALAAVAELSAVGAGKYSWKGWKAVPGGTDRYGDALARHLLAEEIEGPCDDGPGGTGALHATAVAWNALARLELMLHEDLVSADDLDWQAADAHLSACEEAYDAAGSAGLFAMTVVVAPCRARLADGERSRRLFNEIMEISL